MVFEFPYLPFTYRSIIEYEHSKFSAEVRYDNGCLDLSVWMQSIHRPVKYVTYRWRCQNGDTGFNVFQNWYISKHEYRHRL